MSTDGEAEPPTQRIPARVFLNYASEDRERAIWYGRPGQDYAGRGADAANRRALPRWLAH